MVEVQTWTPLENSIMWQHFWPPHSVFSPYPNYVYRSIFLSLACAKNGIYKQYKKQFNHSFEFHENNHNKLIDYPYVKIWHFLNTYNQWRPCEYHVLNITIFDWGTIQRGLNYYNTLYNLQTKDAFFSLFVRIAISCWLGKKGNYNKVSFANTYIESSFFIVFNNSKFMNDYKIKISQWTEHYNQKCTYLNWHENW